MRKATLALLALFLAACSTPGVSTMTSLPASSGVTVENGLTDYGGNGQIAKANDTPGGPIVKANHKRRQGKPLAVPTCAPASTTAYSYHGVNVYAGGNPFQRNVSSAMVSSDSATIMSEISTATFDSGTDNQPDEEVNLGTSSTPQFTVQYNGGHTPPFYNTSTAPWVDGWFIEPAPLTDEHAVSMLTDECVDYESYHTVWTPHSGPLGAYDGQENNLNASWASQVVPDNDAMTQAGIPFIGTVDYGEDKTSANGLHHVIAMMMPNGANSGVSRYGYVFPATRASDAMGGGNGCTTTPCYFLHDGDVLRLKSNFDCTQAGAVDAAGQAICAQLKTYGMIVTDAAGEYQLRFGMTTAGVSVWDWATDIEPLLGAITVSTDFDVVQRPSSIVCEGGVALGGSEGPGNGNCW